MHRLSQLPHMWKIVLLLTIAAGILLAATATSLASGNSGIKAKEQIRFGPVEPEHPTTVPQHAPVVPSARGTVFEVAAKNAQSSNLTLAFISLRYAYHEPATLKSILPLLMDRI